MSAKYSILGVVLFAVAASGCSQTANPINANIMKPAAQDSTDDELSDSERELRKNHNVKRVVSGAVTGCVTTGLVTGAITLLASGNAEKALTNAAVGCAVGAVVGGAQGAYVNARVNQVADQQAYYRSLVEAADSDVKRYKTLNATARVLVKDQKQKIAALNADLDAGRIDRDAYRNKIKSAQSNLNILNNNVKEANDNAETILRDINVLKSKGIGNPSELASRKAEMIAQRDQLKGMADDLISVYSAVPQDVRPEMS